MHYPALDWDNWMVIMKRNLKRDKEKQMPLWKERDYTMSGFSYIKIKGLLRT